MTNGLQRQDKRILGNRGENQLQVKRSRENPQKRKDFVDPLDLVPKTMFTYKIIQERKRSAPKITGKQLRRHIGLVPMHTCSNDTADNLLEGTASGKPELVTKDNILLLKNYQRGGTFLQFPVILSAPSDKATAEAASHPQAERTTVLNPRGETLLKNISDADSSPLITQLCPRGTQRLYMLTIKFYSCPDPLQAIEVINSALSTPQFGSQDETMEKSPQECSVSTGVSKQTQTAQKPKHRQEAVRSHNGTTSKTIYVDECFILRHADPSNFSMFKAAANVNVPISTCTAKVEWMERQDEWMGGQADGQMSLSDTQAEYELPLLPLLHLAVCPHPRYFGLLRLMLSEPSSHNMEGTIEKCTNLSKGQRNFSQVSTHGWQCGQGTRDGADDTWVYCSAYSRTWGTLEYTTEKACLHGETNENSNAAQETDCRNTLGSRTSVFLDRMQMLVLFSEATVKSEIHKALALKMFAMQQVYT
ncbi:hypothetical protein U0070_017888 [Myodes glareolus]|uniref:Uncharacterized protein n=1 Tax=Myodes glareolus TaxID=447135 RepID=A0AAW0K862_MYOGA